MATETYAIVRTSDNRVINLVVWDGTTAWSPPAGTTAVALGVQKATKNSLYAAGVFTF